MTTLSSSNYAYADDVKEAILLNRDLFVNSEEETSVIFEKTLDSYHRRNHYTIADSLIFSSEHGLTGVEIKTARDSKKRLEGQLKGYTEVCDYTYVLVHDEMLSHILGHLEQYPEVGVICYTELEDRLVLGKVREAQYLQPSLKSTLMMLWTDELWRLFVAVHHKLRIVVPKQARSKYSTKAKMASWLADNAPGVTHELFIQGMLKGKYDVGRTIPIYDFKRRR